MRQEEEARAVRQEVEARAVRQEEEARAVRQEAEGEAKRQHEKYMLKIQLEADRLHAQDAHEASVIQAQADSSRNVRISGRSPKLPSFCDGKDNMDAYLQRFERYAENKGWDPGCHGTYLGFLLSGKAPEVYSRLPASDARDYLKLKEALLIRYQLTQEDYRNKFYSGTQSASETAAQFIARLEHLFDHWVRLSKIGETFAGLRELILMEQFLYACPRELALFVRERSPKDLSHLVDLANVFTSTRMAVGGRPKVSNPPSRNPAPQPAPRVGPPQQPFPRRNYGNPASNRCFLCNDPGHRAASCPTGKPRPYYDKSPAPPGIPSPVRGNAAVALDHQCSFHDGKNILEVRLYSSDCGKCLYSWVQ